MSRIGSVGNDKLEEQKRRESVLSVISEPNAGTVRSKKTHTSDGDSFAPSKHFDFRFTREKLLEIKRGMWLKELRSSGADSFLCEK
jgi:hypothetical protein